MAAWAAATFCASDPIHCNPDADAMRSSCSTSRWKGVTMAGAADTAGIDDAAGAANAALGAGARCGSVSGPAAAPVP